MSVAPPIVAHTASNHWRPPDLVRRAASGTGPETAAGSTSSLVASELC